MNVEMFDMYYAWRIKDGCCRWWALYAALAAAKY